MECHIWECPRILITIIMLDMATTVIPIEILLIIDINKMFVRKAQEQPKRETEGESYGITSNQGNNC